MSDSTAQDARPPKSRFRPIEVLVDMVILGVLIAILYPAVQWVSDGTRNCPFAFMSLIE